MIQTYKQITKQVHKNQQTNMGKKKKTEIKPSYKIFKSKTNTQTKKTTTTKKLQINENVKEKV
jgi:hypothetical protein